MGTRVFIPFGEFLPDRKLFGNEGLLRAFGVTPISGNYIQAPAVHLPFSPGSGLPGDPLAVQNPAGSDLHGFHLHQTFKAGVRQLYGYYGAEESLAEIDITAATERNASRAGTPPYAFSSSPPKDSEMWWFTSFGENVIATNFEDEVQLLATPGTGAFANMITSTFKPQGRFVFPVRQNLFLAYCFLPATFDGVASGTHPQLLCWSMNDNIQVFGSENVDPAQVGAGYQQFLGGDLGPITAAIGGDFGLVFLAGGIVRIDGPPYEFRNIVLNDTTLYPYSVFRLGDDVYFWGSGGPSVLRGGEAPVERLGVGKLQRSLLDNATGFGSDFAKAVGVGPRLVSGGADPLNDLARWSYPPIPGAYAGADAQQGDDGMPSLLIDYSLRGDRFTVSRAVDVESGPEAGQDYFLRQAPAEEGLTWGPFNTVFGLKKNYTEPPTGSNWFLFRYELKGGFGDTPDMELRTAFGRLSETHTSRIVAVRPIWSHTEGNTAAVEGAVEITVHTKNKPWEDETDSDVHTVFNDDGWIGTDSTVIGTYHSVTLKFLATTTEINEIHEIEGLEIEYFEGAEYGA